MHIFVPHGEIDRKFSMLHNFLTHYGDLVSGDFQALGSGQ